jgi:hypothetical protein
LLPALPPRRTVQPKLAIGPADDPLEHEAERIADQAMRMPASDFISTHAPARISRKCEARAEEEHQLQAKPDATSAAAGSEAPPIVHEVLGSSGRPLDTATRAFFEPRFGQDFSQIRVHTDQQAARSAQSVGALAYASGSHIAFGAGQYAPATDSGKALLAHELAHTLQQTRQNPVRGMLGRRVAGVNCAANQFGASDDPRGDLETADQIAIDLSNQMAEGLAADSQTVRDGIPDNPSATLQAFEDHLGLPVAVGAGFLNRMTGIVRPTQEIALSEELSVVSRRFAGVARVMGQGLSYNCPGNLPLNLVGCPAGTCAGADAFSCPGNSLVALCTSFWTNFDDTARAQILIHESLHITLGNIASGAFSTRQHGVLGAISISPAATRR